MKRGTMQHPKFKRLKRRLGRPAYQVAGVLEGLWSFTAEFAEDGDLSRFDAHDIADHMEWDGDARELVEALVAERWLDRQGRRLTVHDWHDHLPEYLRERARKRRQRNDLRDDCDHAADDLSRDIPGMSGACPVPVLSDLVQPSQGKAGQEHASRVHARAPEPPRPLPPKPTIRGGISAPLPSMLHEAQEIRVEALGPSARLSDSEERRLRAYASECMQRGDIPAFLEQWRGFHADAYWRGRAPPCPLSAFLKEPSKYGASAMVGFQRPVSKCEGSEVIE